MKKSRGLIFLFMVTLFARTHAQDVKIDHIVWAVNDLDSAVTYYSNQGFTIKPGRLHANGLLNAHIKFPNGSSLELMTVSGEAGDEEAREYKQLLDDGDGGAFLALSGIKFPELIDCLDELEIDYTLTEVKLWSYITFPPNSGMEHIFFIYSDKEYTDAKAITTHQNGLDQVNEVIIEGNKKLNSLLLKLGLKATQTSASDKAFVTATGRIVVTQKPADELRPKVRAVVFGQKGKSETFRVGEI